jgi:hypothetical protein
VKRVFLVLLFSGWLFGAAQSILPSGTHYDLLEVATLNQASLNLDKTRVLANELFTFLPTAQI